MGRKSKTRFTMPERDVTYEQAGQLLDALPEYHWLTRSSQAWWSAAEIAKGMAIHGSIVTAWLKNKEIPGAIEYPGKWAVPRSALLVFLAKRHLQSFPS
jgi:hypothetical protein